MNKAEVSQIKEGLNSRFSEIKLESFDVVISKIATVGVKSDYRDD